MNHVKALVLAGLFVSPLALADEAPVMSITPVTTESASAPAQVVVPSVTPDTSNMSINQRVAVLERQMAAMNQIGLLNQVNNLQQQLQDLQGQVQVLTHTVQTLQTQSTSQYADLDTRLQKLEGTKKPTVGDTAVVATGAAVASSSTATNIADQALYEKAYDNIKAQHNAEAIVDMKNYIAQYPQGQYASNAHYWLGQLYLLKGDSVSVDSAITEFKTVAAQYPQSEKVPDAKLKLGFAYLLQNKTNEAKDQFRKVMKDYPGTPTAQLAEARLAQLPS